MTPNDSLQTLLALAQARSDAAARMVGASCTREQSEEQKLQMLISYRADYQNNFRLSLANGVSPVSWANFQEFMNKLDMAVKQQSDVVAHWRRQAVASRQEWEQQQRQFKSYDTLAQRQQVAQIRRDERREQRDQDEFAAKAHARRRSDD